jgi:hypothetical protein
MQFLQRGADGAATDPEPLHDRVLTVQPVTGRQLADLRRQHRGDLSGEFGCHASTMIGQAAVQASGDRRWTESGLNAP